MKLLTTAAMALALTGAAAAAHADNQNDQQRGQHAQPHAAPPARSAPQPHMQGPVQGGQHFNAQVGAQGQSHWQGQGGQPVQGGQHFHAEPGVQGQSRWQGQGVQQQGQANGQVQRWNGQQSGQHFYGQSGARGGNLGFQDHSLRGRDQGRGYYSANAFARSYHAERQFRFGGYRSYPSGWGFRAWNYGDFLPFGWFSSQYYLDWADYGLPPPPVGCEWVAEGPDAVLVDIWTGEVLSVYRGVFYWNG